MMRHRLTAPGMAVTTRQAVTSPLPPHALPGRPRNGAAALASSPAAPQKGRAARRAAQQLRSRAASKGGGSTCPREVGEAVLSEGRRGCSEVGRGDGRTAGSRASVLGDSSGKNFVLALCPLRVWSPRVAWSAPLPTGRSSASPRCLRVTTAGVLAAVRQAQLPAAGR